MYGGHKNFPARAVIAAVTLLALALPGVGGLAPAASWSSSSSEAAEAGEASADASRREYRLKAAFVYRFLQFTEWPAEAFAASESPIVVVIVGENPFEGALEEALAGKQIGGREVRVRHLPALPEANGATGGGEDGVGGGDGSSSSSSSDGDGGAGALECHMVFVPRSLDPAAVAAALRRARATPVLTVSDGGEAFTASGGVLRLFVAENRVRFEVNLTALQRQRLKMSAQVLRLARIYEEPRP